MEYKHLLSVQLEHKYYDDLVSREFKLYALPQTLSLMQGYRVVSRTLPHKIDLVQEVDAVGNPIYPLPFDTPFHFGMVIDNPCFQDITNEVFLPSSDVVLFTNDGVTSISGLPNRYELLRSPNPYMDTLPFGKKWFGVIELLSNNTFQYGGGVAPTFAYTFPSMRVPLKYYIVASNPADTYTAQDQSSALTFTTTVLTTGPFTSVEESLLAQFPSPTFQIHKIESTTSVPKQETGRENLHLIKNGTQLIDDLPDMPQDKDYRIIHTTPILL